MIVQPEEVAERHYFLEPFYNTYTIWGIRIAVLLCITAAIVIYVRYSRKK